jgi:hypothetical protein
MDHSLDLEDARGDDIEAPLFELEERMDLLESKLAAFQSS